MQVFVDKCVEETNVKTGIYKAVKSMIFRDKLSDKLR